MSKSRLRTFKDAVIIITGGASGIGRALGEELASRGADVFLADLQTELANEVVNSIKVSGGKAESALLDVTDHDAVKKLVNEVYFKRGRIDYIFNNAGIAIFGEAFQYSHEDWENVLNVNLHGVVHGIEAAYPIMIKQGFGHIVNTASMAGLIIVPYLVSYAATKYAVLGLSKTLRIEARPHGVKVSVICPGVIRTPIIEGGKFGKMLINLPEEIKAKAEKSFKPMDPKVFAKKVINNVANNKAIIIVPSWWRIFWWIERISEPLAFFLCHLQHRSSCRILKKGHI
jgi:NAD(P)-dependent dehydrogenase (short-subunit alcohol dehydrogenase family)